MSGDETEELRRGKRARRILDHDEDYIGSQQDLYIQEDQGSYEEEDAQMEIDQDSNDGVDLFTQARTQVEGNFINNSGVQSSRSGNPDASVKFIPKPKKEDVIEVRRGYTSLLSDIQQKKTTLMDHQGTEELTSMVMKANNLLSKVHTTSDSSLDARFISAAAELGAEKIQKLPFGTSTFAITDFVNLMKTALSRLDRTGQGFSASQQASELAEQESWDIIGKKASIYWKGVNTCDFLLGPIAITVSEKTRVKSNRASKEKAPVKEVSGMSKEDFEQQAAITSNAATTSNVMAVAAALQQYESVPFYHFITNPESFSRSVENLFYCSFLVHEGRAALELAEDGELFIRPVYEDADSDEDSEGSDMINVKPKHQAVFNFSMAQWHAAKQKYDITEPLIDF